MPTVMPRSYATTEYVHSRVVQYCSQVVDLRWCISIHSCEVCPFQSSDATSPFECQAVHYGLCTPIRRSLLRHPARLQQPQKRQVDIPARFVQGAATCRTNESSPLKPLAVISSRQATEDEDGVSFLLQKRIQLLQRREQERKQQRTILRPDSQCSATAASGDVRSTTAPGSTDAPLSSIVSRVHSKLPTPGPLSASTVIAPVTTTTTSVPITFAPFAPLTAVNNSTSSVFCASPNRILSQTYPARAVPLTVLPCRPFGTSLMTPHSCPAVGLTSSPAPLASSTSFEPVTSVINTSLPLTSSSLPILSLITELETLSLPNSEIALFPANSIKQSRNLTSSNISDSYLCQHDVNSNKVGPEKCNDATKYAGQTLIRKDLPQLEPFHSSSIPQFYFPGGSSTEAVMFTDELLSQVVKMFEKFDGKVKAEQMGLVAKACGLPLFWKYPLFLYAGAESDGTVSLQSFLIMWKKLSDGCHDFASLFVHILAKPDQNYLEFNDFVPFIQDVVSTHPGLAFLEDAVEFHSHYVQTVIARIFYSINRSWSGQITPQEVRKSSLLQTICLLEDEEDINRIVDYFSYEHFYVIYCKFWELDLDHDFLLSKADLLRHNDQAINSQIVDRIFSGAVTRNLVDGKLSFPDFVWFLISEEDKRHPRSVEYWFRCMDVDGDGVLSMYELECFYMEQVEKLDILGIDVVPFCDCLCQMIDMVRPKEEGKIRLSDLKSCSLAPTFFDTFINVDKYLEHEQTFCLQDQIGDHPQVTDWERFAAEEYEMLLAENNSSDYYQEETQVWPDRLPLDPSHTEQQSLFPSSVTEPLKILSNTPITSYSNNICDYENTVPIIQSDSDLS